MLELLQTILAFVVTLGLLVTVHEFGHFWVARRCGVKVLRFSVGFGRPLWTWRDRQGTEFSLAALPLGGYVKMVDEREMEVPEALRDQAFNHKSVWQRIAIVAAGPLANFLLAIAAFWLMFMLGVTTLVPLIGAVNPDSPAARAGIEPGYEVVAVDGQATSSWYDVNLALLRPLGESRALEVELRPFDPVYGADTGGIERYRLNLENWLVGQERPEPITSLGLLPWAPEVPAVIGMLDPAGAAADAGLAVGDRLLSADGAQVGDWSAWVALIQNSADQRLVLEIERDGQRMQRILTPRTRTLEDGRVIGFVGAGAQPPEIPSRMQRTLSYNPLAAVPRALGYTWEQTSLTLNMIQKMVAGLVSVKNLSGPITIAKVAGTSARSGLESFLHFLAMLSISLGVLNLLPIPVLDGGHLLFYLLEAVRGRPVPEKIQEIGFRIGLSLILALMLLAVWNDIARL